MNITDIKHCCRCKCHKPRTDFSESTCTRDGKQPSSRCSHGGYTYFPRDLWGVVKRVAAGSWYDVVLLWRGILADERIDTDSMGLRDE
jgi:hypothetical protein